MTDESTWNRVTRKNGDEPFHRAGESLGFSALNFWQWAMSDFLGNTERAVVAEFIVAMDLGLASGVRVGWDACDLRTQDKVRVEVKAGGYVQSWHHERLSKIIFGIRQSRAWDPTTNTMDALARRNSDVYVFCVLAQKCRLEVKPMDLSQWEFYVLPTSVINAKLGTQKSIGLESVKRLGAEQVRFGEISAAIARCCPIAPAG